MRPLQRFSLMQLSASRADARCAGADGEQHAIFKHDALPTEHLGHGSKLKLYKSRFAVSHTYLGLLLLLAHLFDVQ